MTIALGNIINHEEDQDNDSHLKHVVSLWMRRNWTNYDGDIDSIVEQAIWEYGINQVTALKLALELVPEFN